MIDDGSLYDALHLKQGNRLLGSTGEQGDGQSQRALLHIGVFFCLAAQIALPDRLEKSSWVNLS